MDDDVETTLQGWITATMPALSRFLAEDGEPLSPERVRAFYRGKQFGARMDAESAVRVLANECTRLSERVATLEAAAAPSLAAVQAQATLKNN